jgi:hypothetical protein
MRFRSVDPIHIPLQKNKSGLNIFLALLIIEGIVAILMLFRLPSEGEHAFFLGYSASRLAVAGIFSFFILLLAIFSLIFVISPGINQTIRRWIDAKIYQKDLLLHLICIFSFIVFACILIFVLFNSSLSVHLNTITAIYHRIDSMFFWLFAFAIQTIGLIALSYRPVWQQPGFFERSVILKDFLVLIALFLTVSQWIIFTAQDAFFTAIPGWYWQFALKSFSIFDIYFIVILVVSLFVARNILENAGKIGRSLVLIALLGYGIQIGFGFAAGKGFESIREKFVQSGHNQYAMHASDDPTFFEALRTYEGTYTVNYILGTKPPGGLAFYMLVQKISNLINPVDSFIGRHLRLTTFAAYVFPLLAILTVPLLYFLAKKFVIKEQAILACLLFVFCPNFILMVTQLDQFLYPTLFLGGMLLTVASIKRKSIWLGVLTGGFVYLSVYISFSLIPMVFFYALWLGISYWTNKKEFKFSDLVRVTASLIVGLLLFYGLFRLFLNYDPLLRYQNAFAWHRTIKLFEPGIRGMLNAIYINNLEFALWTGIPIAIVGVVYLVKFALSLKSGSPSRFDWLFIAFFVTYIILNITGQTRSEVGRLWFFLVPLVVLFVSMGIQNIFKERRNLIIYSVITIQLVTTFVTFHFQDFY